MKINGWDISRADARQWNVTPGFHELKNDSEWVGGSPVPVLYGNEIGFKSLAVKLLVKSDGGRQAILNRCSQILSRLREPAELELDRFEHRFYGILTKYTHNEDAMKRFHTLTLTFDGYEYGTEIAYPRKAVGTEKKLTVYNPGNIVTPCAVEITPTSTGISVTLTGICRDMRTGADLPVTIKNPTKDKTISLDGETGLFTQEGKAREADIWGLPTLAPGENVITSDNIWIDIAVRFKPRYM